MMDEQDKKLLELYKKDLKKRRILFSFIATLFVIVILLYGFYTNYKKSLQDISNNVENIVQEEIEDNIINTNSTNEDTVSDVENSINEIEEKTNEKVVETKKEENTLQEKKKETKENTQINEKENNKNKEKEAKEKPANKDFLFVDGYTMDNVTQAAQDYLKSYNGGGECIPIKDNEGVYLGMRVIFY